MPTIRVEPIDENLGKIFDGYPTGRHIKVGSPLCYDLMDSINQWLIDFNITYTYWFEIKPIAVDHRPLKWMKWQILMFVINIPDINEYTAFRLAHTI